MWTVTKAPGSAGLPQTHSVAGSLAASTLQSTEAKPFHACSKLVPSPAP